MFSRHRWDKEMMNRDEEYNRLHDHCQAFEAVSVIGLQREVDKWRGLATMMSHFDICTSARIECNICAEARIAYVEALSQ
jgi:hypothetical protein